MENKIIISKNTFNRILNLLIYLRRILFFRIRILIIIIFISIIFVQFAVISISLFFPKTPNEEFVSIALIIGMIMFLELMINRTSYYILFFKDEPTALPILESSKKTFSTLIFVFVWDVIFYFVYWFSLTQEHITFFSIDGYLSKIIMILIYVLTLIFISQFLIAFVSLTIIVFLDEAFPPEENDQKYLH